MGFIASMTRYVGGNSSSRKSSTAHPQRHFDDDSNDLIQTSSHTASLVPTESIASTSTMAFSSSGEATTSTSSMHGDHHGNGTWDINIRTLFDEVDTLDPATSRAIKALSLPDHPVLKMETIETPSATTPKNPIQTAIHADSKDDTVSIQGSKAGRSSRFRMSWDRAWYREPPTSEVRTRTRLRRSMTGFLKRRSVKSPSQPASSLGTAQSPPSTPRWIDAARYMEKDIADETDEFNWLEENGPRRSENENAKLWAGEFIGRLH
ncbi:Uncharacterized protein PECH_005847 [Penicillium ucsense]|uniref:Uncharacterized protein n=1 Tax=Penicillium ucsense TaxID=2839758 RepID=A0A8J8W8K3_9EURO|nr:Uncharacterized protein PECM_000738 [Penicillium ucsense]KAF7736039.1 Uncharacterized protein PECH_005847 [Penicillium ucsense]